METSTNPSPKVILHGFLHVTMKVLNSYENIKICVDFWRKFNNNLKKNIYHKLEMGLNMLLWKDEKK